VLTEVPIMLLLVYISLAVRKTFPEFATDLAVG